MGLTGGQKFAVFLCKFRDNSNVEPFIPEFYRQLIVERGHRGLNDYWIAASQGAINLDAATSSAGESFNRIRPISLPPGLAAGINPRRHGCFSEIDTSKYEA